MTITIRVVLALVVGLGVAQLFRSVKNYNQRKDWTDIFGRPRAVHCHVRRRLRDLRDEDFTSM